jgi:hypothetical protein
MVSFRRDQFRALLVAIVVADAVSQGYLPWQPGPLPTEGSSPIQGPWPGALGSDRGCHLLAGFLNRLLHQPIGALTVPRQPAMTAQLSSLSTVTAMLATLPMLLPWLDTPKALSHGYRAANLPADSRALIAFYQCLAAFLNQPPLTRPDLEGILPSLPTTGEKGVFALAAATVLSSAGDFELTLGQSLHAPVSSPGLPIVSSLLCAAWGGWQAIPVDRYQVLRSPAPPLRRWLENRWQLTSLKRVDDWAGVLWQQWLGCYRCQSLPAPLFSSPPVQPIVQ